jgi:hypothetical protein
MSKVDQLIQRFKDIKEELNKNMNMSYSTQPNSSNATTGTSCGQGSMYRSEEMDKDEGVINALKQLRPNAPKGPAGTPGALVASAKQKLANNKAVSDAVARARAATAPGLNAKVTKSECLKFDNNGQWSLDKVDPKENINIPHSKDKAKMANGVNKEDSTLGTNQRLANPPEKSLHDGRGNVHVVKDEGTNEEAASSKPHNKDKFKVLDEVKEKESKKEKVPGLPYNGEDKKVHKSEKVLVGTGTNDENKSPGRNGGFGL